MLKKCARPKNAQLSPERAVKRTMKSLRGFTLVELLVVVVIIAILCALILPAVQSTLRNRDETAALSDMRQIGIALALYTGENSYTLPGRVKDPAQNKWPVLLGAYLKDSRVYAAPGQPNYLTLNQDPLSNARNHTSFIMNGFNDKGAYDDPSVQLRINQFESLSNIILFGMQFNTDNFYMDFVEGNENDVLKLDAYHGGSNYLYADGSSRYMTKAEYVALRPGTNIRNGDWMWLADKTYVIPPTPP